MESSDEMWGAPFQADLARRLELLEYTARDARALDELRTVLGGGQCEAFVERLYTHLLRFESTAALLGSNRQVERLKRKQAAYFQQLLAGQHDEAYARSRIRIGRAHHRIRLSPRWYIATYSLHITELLGVLWQKADDADQAGAWLGALLKVVCLDAGLALDAYEVDVRTSVSMGDGESRTGSPTPGNPSSSDHDPSRDPSPGDPASEFPLALAVTSADVGIRRSFLGLTPQHGERLRNRREMLLDQVDTVLDAFYARVTRHPWTRPHLSDPHVIARLRARQIGYWDEMFRGEFDRAYAATRVHVGTVHEKIGLRSSLYLAGVCVELTRFASHVLANDPDPIPVVDALVRGCFFDMTFVLDAYMASRLASLLLTERFARHLVDRIASGVLVVDQGFTVVSANMALIRMFETEGELLLGMRLWDALPGVDLQEHLAPASVQPQQRRPVIVESVEGDRSRLFRVVATDLPADPGGPRLALVIDDITEMLEVGRHTEHVDARLRTLLDEVGAVVWEADPGSQSLSMISAGIERLTGRPAAAYLRDGAQWSQLLPPVDRERWLDALGRMTGPGTRFAMEHDLVHTGGDRLTVRTAVHADRAPSDPRAILRGVTVDITELAAHRDRLETRLRREQLVNELLRLGLSAPSATTAFDHGAALLGEELDAGVLVLEQSAAGRLLTVAQRPGPRGAVDPPRANWTGPPFSIDLERKLLQPRHDAASEAQPDTELLAALECLGASSALCAPLRDHRSAIGSVIVYRTDDGVFDRDASSLVGTVAGIIGLVLEKDRTQRQALHTHKLQALGTMAGGLAHEINNRLAVLRTHTDILHAQLGPGSGSDSEVGYLERSIDELADLVSRTLGFARPVQSGRSLVRVEDVFQAIVPVLKVAMPPSITVQTSARSRATLLADAQQLEQVVTNLALNGAQAMPKGGRVDIDVDDIVTPGSVAVHGRDLPPGRYVRIQVRDGGTGLTAEVADRAFEPFFTTKPDTGTGLGLGIVWGIVDAHGGGVRLEPEASGGTVATVFLPVADPDGPPAGALERRRANGHDDGAYDTQASPRILLVEDHTDLRVGLVRLMETIGFRAVACEHAEAALTQLRSDDAFDVVITDEVMPGMSGQELAQHIAELRPDVPVVLMTGSLHLRRSPGSNIRAVLRKPVRLRELVATLRTVNVGGM